MYVYEGIEREAPKSDRYRLIEPHYFSGVYDGKENGRIWDEVREYIEAKYDLDSVKHIYLNSDGGTWITGGSRKSSRPMGWSKVGANQMAKLRAYYWNKGDMLELVRYQKEALSKAAGAESQRQYAGRKAAGQRLTKRHGISFTHQRAGKTLAGCLPARRNT